MLAGDACSWAIAQVRWPRRRAAADCCFQRLCLQPSGSQLAILPALLPARRGSPERPRLSLAAYRKRGSYAAGRLTVLDPCRSPTPAHRTCTRGLAASGLSFDYPQL